ncbi:MAG: ATP-dependent RNA helicase HrpA, partial [Desulfofustis sp.]|nr:ATP-dependent RNA helicase HrpA [Desulfofustis sp.]
MEFSYPAALPITPFVPEIAALLREHQVVVIAGETGSGKTTQLPKICLDLFPDRPGLIGCTQPRRIAATSVAERVKEELGGHGYLVGSKIRFHDQTTKNTRIKFMTDGVLLAETRQDPFLNQYRCIIIDEAHERNLNVDFLLGYLHRLLKKRRNLQLIITSATIDTSAFAAHFGQAPVLQVTGKTYPVQIVYQQPDETDEDATYVDACVDAAATLCTSYPPGDILIFLPTEKDIRNCCEVLRGRLPQRLILPLFGRLQSADQQQIFKQQNSLKIVVASNVAETSLTVPGIRYVVDSGLARIAVYNPRARTTNLPVSAISRANCDQRAGRCGRIGPGTCLRLYSEEDYLNRPQFPVPEIQRANLAEVILQMVALKLGDPFAFPFLDPPKPGAIREGYRMLHELGALTEGGRLTDYGSVMARLPIDPVISRILIEAGKNKCLREIVIIAAALAIQDPRVRPADKEQLADQAHATFRHPQSDFLMLLTIWNRCFAETGSFSWSALKRFCSRYYLSFQRMREWIDLHEQLSRLLTDRHQFTFNDSDASYEAVHRSLLAGLFRQCARKTSGPNYQGIGNRELVIFPGSHQHAGSGPWIMAGSFIETSRLFALTVATIEPEWIESAAADFCSYSWTNPRWQKKTGRVIADESVSLYGLVLVSGRAVNFGSRDEKNRTEARKIFIQQALIDGQISGSFNFLKHNGDLLERWRAAEARLRKRDIIVDDGVIYDFYDDRLPPSVYDRQSLIKAIKRGGEQQLLMTEADILLRAPGDRELIDYPPTIRHGSIDIDLRYHFEPGSPDDGVTAILPEHLVDNLKSDLFDWLVPGLLPEKTAMLLKGLPKRLRKRLIPINETVERLLDEMPIGSGTYLKEMAKAIAKLYSTNIGPADWPTQLPDHLRMRFVVTDPDGREIRSGRDLLSLQHQSHHPSAERASGHLQPDDEALVRDLAGSVFRNWQFGAVKPHLNLISKTGLTVGTLYPALEPTPDGNGVRVVYCPDRNVAGRLSTTGVHRLLQIGCLDHYRQLKRYLKTAFSGPSSTWLSASLGSAGNAREAIERFVMNTLFPVDFDIFQAEKEFQQRLEDLRQAGLFTRGQRLVDSIMAILRQRRELAAMIEKIERSIPSVDQAGVDLSRHLDLLLPTDFLE